MSDRSVLVTGPDGALGGAVVEEGIDDRPAEGAGAAGHEHAAVAHRTSLFRPPRKRFASRPKPGWCPVSQSCYKVRFFAILLRRRCQSRPEEAKSERERARGAPGSRPLLKSEFWECAGPVRAGGRSPAPRVQVDCRVALPRRRRRIDSCFPTATFPVTRRSGNPPQRQGPSPAGAGALLIGTILAVRAVGLGVGRWSGRRPRSAIAGGFVGVGVGFWVV